MSTRKKVLIAVAVLSVATTVLLAQAPPFGQKDQGPGFARGARMWALLAWRLEFDENQIAILKEAGEAVKPYAGQLKQQRQAMREAVESGASDAELQALADAQGDLVGQVSGTLAKAMARLHTTLTPEQKEKAGQLRQRAGSFKDWIGKHKAAGDFKRPKG